MPNFIKKIRLWIKRHQPLYFTLSLLFSLILLDVFILIGINNQMSLISVIIIGCLIFLLCSSLFYVLLKLSNSNNEHDKQEDNSSSNELFLNIISLGIYPLVKTLRYQKQERKELGKTLYDYTFIDLLKMTRYERFTIKLSKFFFKCVNVLKDIVLFIPRSVKKIACSIGRCFSDLAYSFKNGDASTKLNFLFLGSTNIGHKQIGHGIVMLLYQALYFFYLFYNMTGINHIIGLFTLGAVETHDEYFCAEVMPGVLDCSNTQIIIGDDSSKFLLFGIMGVLLLIIFIAVYISSNRNSIKLQEKCEEGRKPQTFKEELLDYTNSKFHRLILALPIIGVFFFTILPLIDMILMAFTNYDSTHQTPARLFTWTGFSTFSDLFGSANISTLFWPILYWTIIWAILATVTNYILGIIMSLLINRKSIKFKKVWRAALVLSIAVPQFVSLLAMNKFLSKAGYLNQLLEAMGFFELGWVKSIFGDSVANSVTTGGGGIDWLSNNGEQAITIFGKTQYVLFAKPTIIMVNLWVGIPYSVLSNTGILMNIPADLYESARIDGASPVKQFFKITLPYIIFVTAPATITQFIGNINNFNVIYFLTGGGPTTGTLEAGKTDLLITWLYKLTVNKNYFNLASAIGILSFVFCSVIGLIMYKNSKSVKDEEAFM